MKKLLRNNSSLIILGLAESVSNTGNWVTMMAVFAMLVFKGDGGVAESSGVFLAGLLPTLLVSPAAGWLLDRFDRRRLMIASELLSGLAVAGLIFTENLALIYTLLALQAVFISLMMPARQSVVPALVAREEITRANAFLQQLSGMIKIGAPILAGALLVVLTPHQAIILDVISFGLSALILSRLPALPPGFRKAGAGSQTAEPGPAADAPLPAADAPRLLPALAAAPRLRLLFTFTFIATLIIIGFDVLSPVYIRDVLGGGENLFGLLVSMVGLGSLVSTLFLMLRKGERDPWPDVLLGVLLLALIPGGMAVVALVPGLSGSSLATPLVIVTALLGGIGNGFTAVQVGTLLQLLSPAKVLGRMSGVFQSTAVGGQLVGIVLTPLLVPGLVSIGVFFTVAAAIMAALVLYAAVYLRRDSASPLGQPLESPGMD